jgi:hypothetical protein
MPKDFPSRLVPSAYLLRRKSLRRFHYTACSMFCKAFAVRQDMRCRLFPERCIYTSIVYNNSNVARCSTEAGVRAGAEKPVRVNQKEGVFYVF